MASQAGRYAPSPSGPLHLGNLRTALLAWCFARSRRAPFLVRIEDLDPQRSRPEHAVRALRDLAALGLDWDGDPWRQSERHDRHREAFEALRATGLLYECWCTRAEIREATLAPHGAGGAYPGTCRGLSARERAQRAARGAPSAWRLDGGGARIVFEDAVAGTCEGVLDDFVVWRGELPAYNLAVVVDDADQGVGEVVRGDDLLETTPRQIRLGQLLGLPRPRYAHVPLVLGPTGARLAKRDGAVTLGERLEVGERVEEIIGWMASSVGLAAPGSAISATEVLGVFAPDRISREPTVLAAQGVGSGGPSRGPGSGRA